MVCTIYLPAGAVAWQHICRYERKILIHIDWNFLDYFVGQFFKGIETMTDVANFAPTESLPILTIIVDNWMAFPLGIIHQVYCIYCCTFREGLCQCNIGYRLVENSYGYFRFFSSS